MIKRLAKKIAALTVAGMMLLSTCCYAEVVERSFSHTISVSQSYVNDEGKEVDSSYDVEVVAKYPHISLDNAEVADKINAIMDHYVNECCSVNIGGDMPIKSLSVSGEAIRSEGYFSVLMTCWTYSEGAAHGNYAIDTFTFDLDTGDVLPLEHFVRLSEADVEFETTEHLLSSMGEPIKRADYSTVTYPLKYYITENDEIYLVFSPYEMADYASGVTHVVLSRDAQRMYNSNNRQYD